MFPGIPIIYALTVALQYSWILSEVSAFSPGEVNGRRAFSVPISSTKAQRSEWARMGRRGDVSGSIGTGNNADLLYTVPIELGNTVVAVNVDTGSSDLWVVSDKCKKNSCKGSPVARYPSSSSSLVSTGTDVKMIYGDSKTGTFASGKIGLETATVAGVAMIEQPFGLVDDTTNSVVEFEASGILGLGFPAGSQIQQNILTTKSGPIAQTDDFINSTSTAGPLLSRMALTGALEMPMFSITLQRDTIDISGQGLLTVGDLPDGVDNSSLTWVPVRLYTEADGGLPAPSYAPQETYPFRWEIDIEGVFLDGKQLPNSAIPGSGVDLSRVSALIDTGNSILRGPEDIVNNILSSVSPSFNPTAQTPVATLPCNQPRTLAFQIGGKLFPIDPRDFIGQFEPGNAVTCQADNLVATDPPSIGALFSWSLGTPFFRSNLVAFHFGNLTHPSVDPPRIGILSQVPANAGQLLQNAVDDAVKNGGNFPDIIKDAPTASAAKAPQITLSSTGGSTQTSDTLATPTTLIATGTADGTPSKFQTSKIADPSASTTNTPSQNLGTSTAPNILHTPAVNLTFLAFFLIGLLSLPI